MDYYDDIALFEVANDGDESVTATFTDESGSEATVTIDAHSTVNVTTESTADTGASITLSANGTELATEYASNPADLGQANPDFSEITIAAVTYDEADGLVEYEVTNGNERRVDGQLSHVPLNADNGTVAIAPGGNTTVLVENDESRVSDIYRTTSALQLDLFEDFEDTMEPGDPVPILATGSVTDETPRGNLESSNAAASDEADGCCDGADESDADSDGDTDSDGSGDAGDGSDSVDDAADNGNESPAEDDSDSGNETVDDDASDDESTADTESADGDDTASTGSGDGETADGADDSADSTGDDSAEGESTPGFTGGGALVGSVLSLAWLRRRALTEE